MIVKVTNTFCFMISMRYSSIKRDFHALELLMGSPIENGNYGKVMFSQIGKKNSMLDNLLVLRLVMLLYI